MLILLRSCVALYQVLLLLITLSSITLCSGPWQPPPVSMLLLFLAEVSWPVPAGSEKGGAARDLPCFSFLCTDSASTCLFRAGVPDVSPWRCVDQSWDRPPLWPGPTFRFAFRGDPWPLWPPAVQGESRGPRCCWWPAATARAGLAALQRPNYPFISTSLGKIMNYWQQGILNFQHGALLLALFVIK